MTKWICITKRTNTRAVALMKFTHVNVKAISNHKNWLIRLSWIAFVLWRNGEMNCGPRMTLTTSPTMAPAEHHGLLRPTGKRLLNLEIDLWNGFDQNDLCFLKNDVAQKRQSLAIRNHAVECRHTKSKSEKNNGKETKTWMSANAKAKIFTIPRTFIVFGWLMMIGHQLR